MIEADGWRGHAGCWWAPNVMLAAGLGWVESAVTGGLSDGMEHEVVREMAAPSLGYAHGLAGSGHGPGRLVRDGCIRGRRLR